MDSIIKIINIIRINKGLSTFEVIDKTSDLRVDLGFDSFDLAELTVRIEDIYDIDIFEEGIVTTIEEIEKKLGING